MTEILGAFLSLLPTPLLVFITSANKLYLRNQSQLNHQSEVLLPFFTLFFLALAVGAVLFVLSRYVPFRYALWAYYLVGPCFLVSQFLPRVLERLPYLAGITNTDQGGWIYVLFFTFTVAVIAFGSTVKPRSAVKPFAAFGLLLLLNEAWVSLQVFGVRGVEAPAASLRITEVAPPESLPNIYHVVLDGFQTDMFAQYLSPEIENALGGFTYFPDNTAIYHTTATSLASTFSSRRYLYDRLGSEYVDEAWTGESSLLARLKKGGYVICAYVPPGEESKMGRPDYVVNHVDHAGANLTAMNATAFVRLWAYSQIPRRLRAAFATAAPSLNLDSSDFERMETGRFLPYSAPVVSALSFEQLIAKGGELPEHGMYLFIHLLAPHEPYVLREDCSFDDAGGKTEMTQQVQCTIRLLQEFLEMLRRLGRFDDSLIVVHGDHGGNYRVKNGVLVDHRSRSLRALLLIKPFGKNTEDGFSISEVESSLLDVTPTILDCVRLRASEDFEGNSLTGAAPCLAPKPTTVSSQGD